MHTGLLYASHWYPVALQQENDNLGNIYYFLILIFVAKVNSFAFDFIHGIFCPIDVRYKNYWLSLET